MPKIQLSIIPEPKSNTAAVLIRQPNFAEMEPYLVMSGGGDTDYLCGGCRVVLASQISQGQVKSLVFKCGKCHSYNAVRGTKL
ncbi:hypothetical protein BJL74_22660 [Vibrio parahaemolyticus]|nr:hypothetical protein C9I78_06350 [Vibrio parahaemolyticus]AWJ78064.1 hypothetical protein C7Y67_06470 [Vibrio parahaemolyticus]EGR2734308.1 hypothetical protein [Vibrio parahaemolyticus]EGR2885177.1 hypothetical protein [Vibrio parahaemolyticus]EGR2977745.1 hypothetical protein [Vibrio parahaemolyticus]